MSASGHVPAGESPLESLQREVKEEIGLDFKKSEFKLLGKFWRNEIYRKDFIENELDYIYIAYRDVDISKIKIQKEEVEAVAWLKVDQFKQMMTESKVVRRKEVWGKLFEYLQKE